MEILCELKNTYVIIIRLYNLSLCKSNYYIFQYQFIIECCRVGLWVFVLFCWSGLESESYD